MNNSTSNENDIKSTEKATTNQFSLLKSKRFGPLFITQFLGALNDNLYKNAIIILLTFSAINAPGNLSTTAMVNICAGLFILPFFFFSAFAGVLADLKEKSHFIQILKLIEIATVFLGAAGIFLSSVYLMWLSLFFMGVQAAFFGPLKYSILPQHLKNTELMGGNGLIESGTFIAILIGTILGGVLIVMDAGKIYVSVLMMIFAIIGYFSSRYIPLAPSYITEKTKISYIHSFKSTILAGLKVKSVFLSTLAISWFWFLGATLLAQFPLIVKDILNAPSEMVTVLLGLFAIGMAVGSILCEKLSGHKVEHGLVPLGAFGMTVFLFLFATSLEVVNKDIQFGLFVNPGNIKEWFSYAYFYFIAASLFFVAVFSGFFTVPLYAFIQYRTEEKNRSKIIGATNIWNSLFMVLSAAFAIGLTSIGFNLVEMILTLTVLNLLVAIYVFTVVPEFLSRFIIWLAITNIYKIKTHNLDSIPEKGKGLIVSNHVSYMDSLFIFGLCPRPVKFTVYYKLFNIPMVGWLLNAIGAIPVARKEENEEVFNNALAQIQHHLKRRELVIVFPENKISNDGNIVAFNQDIMNLIKEKSIDIYPCYLQGLDNENNSKGLLKYLPKMSKKSKILFSVGDKINSKNIDDEVLRDKILEAKNI